MKRIYSLDLLRLYFAYVIAYHHFDYILAPGPTVTVQVFFLISGFFLAKKFYSRSFGGGDYDQWRYTLDHAKSLYPHYLLSLTVFFCYTLARAVLYWVLDPSWQGLHDIFLSFYDLIPELTLLQSAYHWYESLNFPLWQLSALLIAGYFVYGLLCWNEKLSRKLLFPAAILMIQSLLYTGVDIWGNYGFFHIPLLRAFSPMCAGVLTYYFTTTEYYTRLKQHKLFFNLAAIYALVTIIAYGEHNNIFLVTTPFLLWGCWEEGSWINMLLNHKLFRPCGSLALAVYMNHAFLGRILRARVYMPLEAAGTPAPLWQQNLVYFLLVTAVSIATMLLTEKWKSRQKAKA